MSPPRIVPLYDPEAQPSSWNERMLPNEYAVHDSIGDRSPENTGPCCTVFSTLAEAEAHAHEQVAIQPELRCRIYDHEGFVGAPIREIAGPAHKGNGDLSPRFRRWTGSVLFFGGLLLTIFDWSVDFRLSWPAMIGVRMVIPGLILLATEGILLWNARRQTAPGRMRKPR